MSKTLNERKINAIRDIDNDDDFKIGKGNLQKDCHKRELPGYPQPSPLLTLALFTHFLVSQGSEFKERAQNYHFIYTKYVKKYLFSQKIQ